MEGREELPALPGNVGEPALSGPSCPQTVAWPGFFGNVAEMPISREGFLGEAGTLLQGVPRAFQGRMCCWATSSHAGTVIGGEEEKDVPVEKSHFILLQKISR